MTKPDNLDSDEFGVETLSPFGVVVRPRAAGEDVTRVPVATARDLVREHRLLVLRDFATPQDEAGLTRYAESWGKIMTWPFGPVLNLVEHEKPADHVFDTTGVTFHWDGMFREHIPEFQIFHCVQAVKDDQGGRTTFCDTTRMLDNASPEDRALWQELSLTYQITNKSHYGGDVVSPLVVEHPERGYPTVRYLEPVAEDEYYVNRPRVKFPESHQDRSAEITESLRKALYDPRQYYAHQWRIGDIVVADNYTLLHGREPYSSRAGRHIRRVHVLGDPPFANPALR